MPPSAPLRDRIKDAMVARLMTMTAGAEYWATPSLVTRRLLAIDQYKVELAQGPVLGVMRTSGSTYGPQPEGTSFEHNHRVAVWGYVKGDLDVPADVQLERLWDDVFRCLLADPSLNDLVMDLQPEGSLDTDDGALEPLGFFAQTWLATR